MRTVKSKLGGREIDLRIPVPSTSARLIAEFQKALTPDGESYGALTEQFYARFLRTCWLSPHIELPEDDVACWEAIWDDGIDLADCLSAVLDWAEAVKAHGKKEADAVETRTAHFRKPGGRTGSGDSAPGDHDRTPDRLVRHP